MDLLKKALLVTFYLLIILLGVVGFLVFRSLRGDEKPFQPDQARHEQTVVNS